MTIKYAEFHKSEAIETLRGCRIELGADFHTLSSTQVEALLAEADRVKYRRPTNANGSRARYFHAMLKRRATKAE